jgi:hypothetical protein
MRRALSLGVVLTAAAFYAGAAQATMITGLYNTGVDVSNGVDLAWTITGGNSDPALGYPSPTYADASNGTFPIPPWVPNTSVSSWITPSTPLTSNLDPNTNGYYDYTTTFDSTSKALLAGMFAADNEVACIILDGKKIYTGPTNGSSQYSIWTDFQGWVKAGLNTITFDVVNYGQNGGNPSGLDVEFLTANGLASNISETPLPSSWTLMLIGLAGFGFAAYRRQGRSAGLAAA